MLIGDFELGEFTIMTYLDLYSTKVHLLVDRIEPDTIMVATKSEVQLEDNRLAEEDYRMEKPKAKGDSKDEDEGDMVLVEETPSLQQGN